jgi:hypothetical protein
MKEECGGGDPEAGAYELAFFLCGVWEQRPVPGFGSLK